MKKRLSELPLRSGVGIVVLNKQNKVFVAKRIDNPKNFWQMPQGGVDEGENFLNAAYRELAEETSIKKVNLIQELEGTITGEHGIGLQKKDYLLKQHPDNIPLMKLIKKSFDPNNILNPGKVFDI